MNRLRTFCSALVVGLVVAGSAGAEEGAPKALVEALTRIMPAIQADSIKKTPVAGMYEVLLGQRIFYFTADGKHFFRGDLIDVAERKNLTEGTRRTMRIATLTKLGEESMVVFGPEKARRTITVFTDIDCPYCAKLHLEVPKLTEAGVKVRYAAFPRAGIESNSYRKLVSVWCAGDPQQAMTDAKARKPIEKATCERSEMVKKHFGQGHALGVDGTPTIILDSGDVVPGYRNAKELLKILESS